MAKLQPVTQFPILGQSDASHSAHLRGLARLASSSPIVDRGHQVQYRALTVRSILNRSVSRRGLDFTHSINPYRGCEFACHYCYARYTHEYLDKTPLQFEQEIYIKQDAAWLLQQELRRCRPGDSIAIGTATDPYQPIERRARITRSLLEVLARYRGLSIGIVTKSTLLTRDIDLFRQIAARNQLRLNLTITTTDTALARKLEPRAPRPDLRFRALQQLSNAGLTAGVLCSPILPGITDSAAALEAVIRAARQHGAAFFHAEPLFLKPCSKELFQSFIKKEFPDFIEQYEQRFSTVDFVSKAYRHRMAVLVRHLRSRYGFGDDHRDVTPPRNPQPSKLASQPGEQLGLFPNRFPAHRESVSAAVHRVSA